MDSHPKELTLRDLVEIVTRRRWVVVGGVLGCVLAALALLVVSTPRYTAEAEVLRGHDLFQNQDATLNDRSIQTQIQIIESQAVRDRVQQDLGLGDLTPDELDDVLPDVDARAVPSTDVISLEVSAEDPDDAALYANAYASAYIEVRREQVLQELLSASEAVQEAIDSVQSDLDAVDALDNGDVADSDDPSLPSLADELANFPSRTALAEQLAAFSTTLNQLRVDAAVRTGNTTIIRVAEVPETPDGLRLKNTVPLAVFLGLVLGLGAAFLIDYLDDKVRTEEDLADLTAVPVLAAVPPVGPADSQPIALSDPGHRSVEAYRELRTNLRFLGLERDVRLIQVTSPVANAGKTSTAVNLAVVLAQAGHRVALVDANLRRPKVHEVLSIPQGPGFTDLLFGQDDADVVHDIDVATTTTTTTTTTLSAYTSGPVPTNPSELLSGQHTRELLTGLAARFDYVIVDSSSVLAVSDAIELSGLVDALLLVVQVGDTTRDDVTEAIGRLVQVDAPVVGIVLNRVPVKSLSRNAS